MNQKWLHLTPTLADAIGPSRRPAILQTDSLWFCRPFPAALSPDLSGSTKPSYRGPFAIMTVLFFMWGFMTVWNDVLIPRFKEAFTLNYFQAMLVQFAFFGAYAVGSLSTTSFR